MEFDITGVEALPYKLEERCPISETFTAVLILGNGHVHSWADVDADVRSLQI